MSKNKRNNNNKNDKKWLMKFIRSQLLHELTQPWKFTKRNLKNKKNTFEKAQIYTNYVLVVRSQLTEIKF